MSVGSHPQRAEKATTRASTRPSVRTVPSSARTQMGLVILLMSVPPMFGGPGERLWQGRRPVRADRVSCAGSHGTLGATAPGGPTPRGRQLVCSGRPKTSVSCQLCKGPDGACQHQRRERPRRPRASTPRAAQRAGITQEEIGARVGIDPTYISRVEGGRINLRWGTLQRFLCALDATLADLARGGRGRTAALAKKLTFVEPGCLWLRHSTRTIANDQRLRVAVGTLGRCREATSRPRREPWRSCAMRSVRKAFSRATCWASAPSTMKVATCSASPRIVGQRTGLRSRAGESHC